jgi:hypothetical protein
VQGHLRHGLSVGERKRLTLESRLYYYFALTSGLESEEALPI